jgi:hypothetical protein
MLRRRVRGSGTPRMAGRRPFYVIATAGVGPAGSGVAAHRCGCVAGKGHFLWLCSRNSLQIIRACAA